MRDKGGIGLISLELSKRLKEAGLEWEPQIGDVFFFKDGRSYFGHPFDYDKKLPLSSSLGMYRDWETDRKSVV